MSKQHLKGAIDHGTCNSSFAVMEADGPRVLKPNGVDDVMPSAVYVARSGVTLVGDQARRAILSNDAKAGDGYTGYKINIGQNDNYTFHASGKTKTARELGSLVIGQLLQAYRSETGEDINACVITVPAKFEHSGTDGTREAARAAGLLYCPLLMEPVAAALAYGYTATNANDKWLIFDLGAGTLDVSLVLVRDGEMIVPEGGQDGDNYLGGGKFDRELFSLVVQKLSREYSLDGMLDRPENRAARGRLMLAVEAAKIRLSTRPDVVVEVDGVLLQDAKGHAVKVDVPVTRAEYEGLIAPDIERAVHVCRNLIERNKKTAGEISRLILIGGPTKTPLIKQMLGDSLGIPLDDSIDPMTAVARGAAIYAATVELPEELRTRPAAVAPGGTSVKLEYESYSKLATYCLVGVVEGPTVASGALTAEVSRGDGLWRSGRLPVDEEGVFTCDLLLVESDRPLKSQFTTKVFDPAGRELASVEEPAIWFPYPADGGVSRVANSLRVGLAGNRTEALVRQGAGLPARNRSTFATDQVIRGGSAESVLKIPVLEGVNNLLGEEDDHADCSALVGIILIHGNDERIRRDLPPGTEVEVTVHEDVSRQIRVTAHIPLIDEEFEASFEGKSYQVTIDEIADRLDVLRVAFDEAEAHQAKKPDPEAARVIEIVQRLDIIAVIAREIVRARGGEFDSHHRAYKRTLELAGTLNRLAAIQRQSRLRLRSEGLRGMAGAAEKKDLDACMHDLDAPCSGETLDRIDSTLGRIESSLKYRPVFDLWLDVFAIGKEAPRVNLEQKATFERAEGRLERGLKNLDNLAKQEVDDVIKSHEELMRSFVELPRWREKLRAEFDEMFRRQGGTSPVQLKKMNGGG